MDADCGSGGFLGLDNMAIQENEIDRKNQGI